MNKRALLIASIIGFIIFIILDAFRANEDFAFGIAGFLIAAFLFHIKPELMGKLNKPNKEDDNNEDKEN